jgi:DNA repair protein RadC
LTLTTVRAGEQRTDVVAAIREMIIGEAQEIVLVAAVDGDHVRDVVEVARGDYHSVRVSLPAVLAVPLLAGCSRLVIAHNHPSGRLFPSNHDYNLTSRWPKEPTSQG